MFYKFNFAGWYCGSENEQTDRCTTIEPEDTTMTEIGGELRSNFTGYEWILLPYIVPATNPISVSLATLKAKLTAGIDDHIAKIYERFTRFNVEYVEREAAARAYRTLDYKGDVSTFISDFAHPTGMTYRDAADRIISQADTLNTALASVSSLRMQKYLIITATTEEACNTKYQQIINQANIIAGGL